MVIRDFKRKNKELVKFASSDSAQNTAGSNKRMYPNIKKMASFGRDQGACCNGFKNRRSIMNDYDIHRCLSEKRKHLLV